MTPPKPVLHDGVDGDVAGAVLVGYVEHLVLGAVAVFGLDVAVTPDGEQGRVAGEVAVVVDDGVELGAVEEVVVDGVGGEGVEVGFEGEAVVEVSEGGGVPEDGVALGGEEQGDGDVGVVLA